MEFTTSDYSGSESDGSFFDSNSESSLSSQLYTYSLNSLRKLKECGGSFNRGFAMISANKDNVYHLLKELESFNLGTAKINLMLEDCDIGNREDVLEIFDIIAKNKNINSLDISRNSLGSSHTKHLFSALASNNNQTLIMVRLNNNNISPKGAYDISYIMGHHRIATRIIDISDNKIGDKGFFYLTNQSQSQTKIRNLFVNNINLTNQGFASAYDKILYNRALAQLSIIDNPQLTEEVSKEKIEAVEKHLDQNSQNAVFDVMALSDHSLNVRCESPRSLENLKNFADDLPNNQIKINLDLSDTNIRSDTILKTLRNILNDENGQLINSINSIDFSNNLFCQKAFKDIGKTFKKAGKILSTPNTSITSLSFSNCTLSDKYLIKCLKPVLENTAIEHLDLSHNNLRDPDILIKLLSLSPSLKSVDLSHNHLAIDTSQKLKETLRNINVITGGGTKKPRSTYYDKIENFKSAKPRTVEEDESVFSFEESIFFFRDTPSPNPERTSSSTQLIQPNSQSQSTNPSH